MSQNIESLRRVKYRQGLIKQMNTPVEQHEIIVDSVKTAWLSAGNEHATGETIVLLHGAGAGAVTWYPSIASIAQHYPVIAPDIVGYGESDKPNAAYDRSYYVNWLNGFLTSLNLTKISLVGLSQGAAIAMQFALDFPEKVNKLVLVNSAGFGAKPKFLPFLGMVWMNVLPSSLANHFASRYLLVQPKLKHKYHGLYSVEVAKSLGGKNAFLQGKGQAVAEISKHELQSIQHKTLVIHGEDDQFFPIKYSQFAAEIIPNAIFKPIQHAGHMPLMDQTEIFNRTLVDFLKEGD
ncbi:2-hydroxy-6-oxo-octa-2,4-dienoate hydrolase [Acinetobacter calcoaceticus]|uniref:2-hydroxy-6-oxo-octa-2,4-dienoate hydrolase n=1 Tax=Acinetobacter calcoaceticus TaxID=471 RepID=A0A4R1XCN3_ACICA|nr:2-hydroxy-6-oxo-octa-2,4-dienoate hydrolase [Acinetobacter calcoaceticus]